MITDTQNKAHKFLAVADDSCSVAVLLGTIGGLGSQKQVTGTSSCDTEHRPPRCMVVEKTHCLQGPI